MSIRRILLAIAAMLVITGLIYTGVWHLFSLFVWQHPMLSWLPLLAVLVVGTLIGTVRALTGVGGPALAASPPGDGEGQQPQRPARDAVVDAETRSGSRAGGARRRRVQDAVAPGVDVAASEPGETEAPAPTPPVRRSGFDFAFGWGLLAGLVVLACGLWFTLISPPTIDLDDIDYVVVDRLPQQTQPRLLPRSGIDDNPAFREAKEVHLVRDPETGELLWTGEWHSSWLGGQSDGIAVKSLDEMIAPAEIVHAGFDEAVAGIQPSTLKGKAYAKHPFSRVQYPVLLPTGDREAIAIAPYIGYKGFPFKTPYMKGVLVYHQDGTLEDLTPEEAAARPDLVRTGRLFPEAVARAQAEALARSDEFEGDIHDGKNNRQPYLTAIDRNLTVWVTIIDDESRAGGVKAIVLTDSSTGETQAWRPSPGHELISSEDVLNTARALPLKWKEERCCDSDGHSYTVTLREVVEARLAFKYGKPYYMVSVVPTDDLALPREIEYTLILDAETGKELAKFDHVNGGVDADTRLQRFFR
ncbi:hypothetical protein AB0E63_15980 [Kribbella sp. NPDC026596]|uniref:hypothetical protein n=1 Tax=Kribbella sp. NPDC026596 TaxID=3155122 RepID=UPI0033D54FD4